MALAAVFSLVVLPLLPVALADTFDDSSATPAIVDTGAINFPSGR